MASVNLPEKCLQDPGRGQAWLLTTAAHFGGQSAVDELEPIVRVARLKGITWKAILNASFPILSQMFAGKAEPGDLIEAIDSLPAPVQMANAE